MITSKPTSNSPDTSVTLVPEPDGYVCPKCFVSFEALFAFNRHLRDQHGERLAPLAHPGV